MSLKAYGLIGQHETVTKVSIFIQQLISADKNSRTPGTPKAC